MRPSVVKGTFPRVERLRDSLLATESEICHERALLVTESYQENQSLPVVIKRAKALAKVLAEITISIYPDELIVGHQSSKRRSPPVFPEMCVEWIETELDEFETRKHNRLKVSEETKKALRSILPYWKGKTLYDRFLSMRPEPVAKAVSFGLIANTHEKNALGHVALNYNKVLEKGFLGIKQEIEDALSHLDMASPDYLPRYEFLKAASIVCDAIMGFAARYANLAREMAERESDPTRRQELLQISEICAYVPANPARTFHEALQSVWFAHLIPWIEANGYSITPGRIDQYLYPFYTADREGGATREELQELLECFWIKFSEVLRVDDKAVAEISSGYPLGQNVALGGVLPDGTDGTNELSFMCLEAHAHIRLLQPNLTVRLHEGTPDSFLKEAVRVISLGNGMPQLLNDETIVESLLGRGIPIEEARDYIPVGCDEITVEGTWARCNGGYLNFAKILELTLNNGRCILTGEKLGLETGDPTRFKTFAELMAAYHRQLEHAVGIQAAAANITDVIHAELAPCPTVSIQVSGCIDKGRDVTRGGARYNFTGPVGVGSATVGDSLAAIKKLVYEEGAVSIEDIIQAIRQDFADHEPLRQMLINRAPKFGCDEDYVDDLVIEITDSFFDHAEKHANPRGGSFMPALYSVTAQAGLGRLSAATPDGRRERTPLSDGLSPSNGMDLAGPTAALKSVSKVDLVRATNGVIFNLRFSPSVLNDGDGLDKIAQFLRTFVDLGGFHVQFNIISTDTLKEAQQNPEAHRGLVVRVAGYSAFFVELCKEVQDSIIARTEQSFC